MSATFPRALREVSGLALSDAGSLFAIADEVGRILELSPETGAVLRQIDIGRPPVTGDFEGLAIHGGSLFAVTSDGKLYQINTQAEQAQHASLTDLKTSEQCELEGLSNADERGDMWLVCKRTLGDGDDDSVRFLRWNPGQPDAKPEQFDLSNQPILDAIDKKNFNPSAVALTADRQGLLVIAARQRSFARFSLTDRPMLTHAGRLPDARLHEQAEGLAISSDGRVFIANEGAKATTGRLFVYRDSAWSQHPVKEH